MMHPEMVELASINLDYITCFYGFGVLFVGILIRRALLFGVYRRAPDCWKQLCLELIPAGSLVRFGSFLQPTP